MTANSNEAGARLDAASVVADTIDLIRSRILHTLEIFPYVSASMIHMAIGTATSTKLWRPVLDQLVSEGIISKTELQTRTPLDRAQTYDIYHLSSNPYPHQIPTNENIKPAA